MRNYLFALGAFCVGMLFVTPTFASNELVGTSWDLVSYDGTGATGTLEITEDMLYSKFCNNVSQGYVYSSGTIIASGAGVSTLMYCEGLPMTLESNFTFTNSGTVELSGSMLTIMTAEQHTFVFEMQTPTMCTLEYMPVCGSDGMTYGNACGAAAAQVTVVSEGVCPSDDMCIQKYDGCNMCSRTAGGEWACTKMYCETPTTPYCIATSDEEEGMVGNDEDSHGCIPSAGYMWSQSQLACVRSWEGSGASDLEVAYDFAYYAGMTTMDSTTTFRTEDYITRQEAAKMLVAFVENRSPGVYSGGSTNICVQKYLDIDTFDYSLKGFIASACAYEMMRGSASGTMFNPNALMTKGEALAILMRSLDGWQTEPDNGQRWMPYVLRAQATNVITFDTYAEFNMPISRGDLIKMTYTMAFSVTLNEPSSR